MFQAKSLEEELYKLKASRSVEDLQKKELEEQLEAEQYFSTLYKTQVGGSFIYPFWHMRATRMATLKCMGLTSRTFTRHV